MADSGTSSSRSNRPVTKPRGRSEARKTYEKKTNATRIFLCDAFERWRAFSEEHNLKTDPITMHRKKRYGEHFDNITNLSDNVTL